MKTFGNLSFEPITEKDIKPLTDIMRRAFDEDTRIHLGKPSGGPPGYDDGSFLRKFGLSRRSTSYAISCEGELVGAIILWINASTHENFLGTIFIDPSMENKGLGKTAWDFVENQYPDTRIWRTETPIFSHRNHHFYINKCGFHVIRIENPREIDNGEGQFILEKRFGQCLPGPN